MTSDLASRQKDLSRSIYISLVAGKVDDNGHLIEQIGALRDVLDEIERFLMLESSGYVTTRSDLVGLAAREAQQ